MGTVNGNGNGEGSDAPYSPEAEISVLGACLIDSDAVDTAAALLKPADFYRTGHRMIFRAVLDLFREGAAVDVVTVSEKMADLGTLSDAGGRAYLAEVLDAVPTGAHVEHHAGVVRDRAKLRELIDACSLTIRDALESNGGGPDPVIEIAEQRIFAVRDDRRLGDGFQPPDAALWGAMEVIEREATAKGGVTGIPTGFPSLDQMTTGLHGGDLTILAARPSHGKSAMMWDVCSHAASEGNVVAVSSLEMSGDQIMKRALASRAGVDLMKIRKGQLEKDEYERLTAAHGWLNSIPVRIDDATGATVPEMRAKVRRLASTEDVAMLVVDYLQLMEGEGNNRTTQIGSVSRGLKRLAREFDIHVLALSQLSRAVENRTPHRPKLSDLRSSGNLEQDADNVLMLWRPEMYFTDGTGNEKRAKWQGKAELIVAKQRNGPLGSLILDWHKSTTSFREGARGRGQKSAQAVAPFN